MSFIQPIYNIRNGTKKHDSHQTQSPSYTPALNFFGYRDVQKNGCGYHYRNGGSQQQLVCAIIAIKAAPVPPKGDQRIRNSEYQPFSGKHYLEERPQLPSGWHRILTT